MASETLRTLRLSAEAFGRDPRAVEARVLELDRAARVRRALRIALPLVGGAILSLPIPGWHLAAVPGFLIAALMLGARRLRQTRVVESVTGSCPACGDSVRFPVPTTARLPDTYPCPACREFVRLHEA